MKPTNIYIIGAQSTEKTTRKSHSQPYTCRRDTSVDYPAVVDALKHHFTKLRSQDVPEPVIIEEVVRSVQKELSIDRNDIVCSPEKSLKLQTAVLRAQLAAQTEVEAQGAW